jgi:hypothetical protein
MMMLDEAMRVARAYGAHDSKNPALVALNELRAHVGVHETAEKVRLEDELGLLNDAQRAQFEDQNRLLRESNAEPVSVSEFLSCRLEDALEALTDVGGRHARLHDECNRLQLRALDAEAEVKRLNELLLAATGAVEVQLVAPVMSTEVDAIVTRLARVEALRPKWLQSARAMRVLRSIAGTARGVTFQACADELEAALKEP